MICINNLRVLQNSHDSINFPNHLLFLIEQVCSITYKVLSYNNAEMIIQKY